MNDDDLKKALDAAEKECTRIAKENVNLQEELKWTVGLLREYQAGWSAEVSKSIGTHYTQRSPAPSEKYAANLIEGAPTWKKSAINEDGSHCMDHILGVLPDDCVDCGCAEDEECPCDCHKADVSQLSPLETLREISDTSTVGTTGALVAYYNKTLELTVEVLEAQEKRLKALERGGQ